MSNTSNISELIKLLCMTDQDLIDLFQTKTNIACLPYAFQYNWRKRLSVNTKSNSITSHEYKWLVEALRCHSQDEILLLREDIERLIKTEEGEEYKKNENNDHIINNIKKAQSCPTFQSLTFFPSTKDVIEKTVNGC